MSLGGSGRGSEVRLAVCGRLSYSPAAFGPEGTSGSEERPIPHVRANGLQIEYEETGEGPALILIMGLGTQLVHWPVRFVEMLADAGFRVIRFDNRDMGLSTHLDELPVPDVRRALARRALGLNIRAPYTLDDMARDVLGLMDALDIDRAHVAGISLGGMIAQTLAIAAPHRLLSMTSLNSSPGDRRYLLPRPSALGALLGKAPRTREQAQERMREVMQALAAPGQELDLGELDRIAGLAWDRGSNPRGFARQFAAVVAHGSRREALRSVQVPTLVIHGKQDPLIPVWAGQGTARAIPGARLEVMDGMGHIMGLGHLPKLARLISSHAGTHST